MRATRAESCSRSTSARAARALRWSSQNDQSQNITWPGTVELLNSIDYHGIRVFNEWGYIQNRYAYCGYTGPEEITNSFFRAVVERNCKVIWLKMILEPDNDVSWDADQTEWTYITDPAAYEKMILDLDARLEPMGYTRTTVPPMELEDALRGSAHRGRASARRRFWCCSLTCSSSSAAARACSCWRWPRLA